MFQTFKPFNTFKLFNEPDSLGRLERFERLELLEPAARSILGSFVCRLFIQALVNYCKTCPKLASTSSMSSSEFCRGEPPRCGLTMTLGNLIRGSLASPGSS